MAAAASRACCRATHSKLNRLTPISALHSFIHSLRSPVSDSISDVCTGVSWMGVCVSCVCVCPDATIYARVNSQSPRRSQWTGSWNVNMYVVTSFSADKNMRAINFLSFELSIWSRAYLAIYRREMFRFKRPIDVRTLRTPPIAAVAVAAEISKIERRGEEKRRFKKSNKCINSVIETLTCLCLVKCNIILLISLVNAKTRRERASKPNTHTRDM